MKKIFTMFLAVIMLVSVFAACKKDPEPSATPTPSQNQGDPSASENTPSPSGQTPSPTPSESGKTYPSLSGIDLGERTITIISRSHDWFRDEVSVENSGDGDPIKNAIFQRNLDTERILNCELENVMIDNGSDGDLCVVKKVETTLGPDCPYQIMSNSAYTSFEYTTRGIVQDLANIDTLRLDQGYWSHYFNEEASFGDAQYYATGAISLSLRRLIFVTFFNKALAENHGFDNLYDVVKDKEWTLDYQYNVIQNTYDDVDADGERSEADFYGLVTDTHICVDPYWTACNVEVLKKDRDTNTYYWNTDEAALTKMDSVLKKIQTLYYDSGSTYLYPGMSGDAEQDLIRKKFTSAETIFCTLRLIEVESEDFRKMTDKYGILPIPKYDEDQEDYYSHAHDQYTVYGIISSVPDGLLDDMGSVLECMAIESYNTVTPAYFEVALKGKYSKDVESWEMLDMIINNLKPNGGSLYTIALGDPVQALRNATKNASTTISTSVFGRFQMTMYKNKLKKLEADLNALVR